MVRESEDPIGDALLAMIVADHLPDDAAAAKQVCVCVCLYLDLLV